MRATAFVTLFSVVMGVFAVALPEENSIDIPANTTDIIDVQCDTTGKSPLVDDLRPTISRLMGSDANKACCQNNGKNGNPGCTNTGSNGDSKLLLCGPPKNNDLC
jgi:hypothetical protein